MGAQSGDEKLHPNSQHVPLLRAFQTRLLQRLQWQTVSEGGCSAHHIRPRAGFIKGADSQHYIEHSSQRVCFQIKSSCFVLCEYNYENFTD